MTFARVSLSLAGVVGLVAVALAAATVWLLVSQPVTTADAAADLARGNVTPLARALAGVLYDALQGLLKYLGAARVVTCQVGHLTYHRSSGNKEIKLFLFS